MKRWPMLALVAMGILIVLGVIVRTQADPANAANFTAVSAGDQHTCAVTSAAGVQCWGRNAEGEVGDGTTTSRPRPIAISGLSYGASFLGVGAEHSCAVLVIWTSVMCWGNNAHGQIGDGTIGTNRLSPTTVCVSGSGGSCVALTGVSAVGGGDAHTCALTSSGGVKCWGGNHYGQLGNGSTTDSLTPVNVSGLTTGVGAIAVGEYHSCALMTTGGVKCWGFNGYGQLGDATLIDKSSPVDVSGLTSGVATIAAGEDHTCAVLTTGNVKCSGSNSVGQLGDGTSINRSTPVSVCQTYNSGTQQCTAILANITRVSGGGAHTCGVTLVSGRNGLTCWGWDGFGQLGDGGAVSLVNSVMTPLNVSGLTAPGDPAQVTAVSAGTGHTCAVLNPSGAVTCWGWNSDGQLGTGTSIDRATWQTAAQDFDRDGCADHLEMQTAPGSETTGGRRNPKNFWDFFDTPDDHRTASTVAIAASGVPTSIGVSSTNGFPVASTSEPKTLFVDTEKFQYTGQNATSFTIAARAFDGTTAAAHPLSAPVVSGWRDGIVNNDDVNRVIARYRSTGDPSADPLGPPPPAPTYSPAYDRTYLGPNAWNLGPPSGQILIQVVTYINNQYGHDCRPTPTPTP